MVHWNDYWTLYSTGLYDIRVGTSSSNSAKYQTPASSVISTVKADINTEVTNQTAAIGTAITSVCTTIATALSGSKTPSKTVAQTIAVACGGVAATGTFVYQAYVAHIAAVSDFY